MWVWGRTAEEEGETGDGNLRIGSHESEDTDILELEGWVGKTGVYTVLTYIKNANEFLKEV